MLIKIAEPSEFAPSHRLARSGNSTDGNSNPKAIARVLNLKRLEM